MIVMTDEAAQNVTAPSHSTHGTRVSGGRRPGSTFCHVYQMIS